MSAISERNEATSSFKWLQNQRVIFLISFLLGTVLLIALRENGAGTVISIFAAAAVMGIYALYGSLQKYLMRPDILGDNLYYLGFLFTLVSLAHTLYRYSSNQTQIDLIIQNFGIALSTTLIGLVLRVFFGQAKQGHELYSQSIQLSLSEAAANLIGEISMIRQDLGLLKTSVVQTVNEGVESSILKFDTHLSNSTNKISSSIDSSFKKIDDGLQKTVASFSESAEQINHRNNEMSLLSQKSIEVLGLVASEFASDIKVLNSNIKKIEPLEIQIQKKVVTPLNTLQEAIEKLTDSIQTPAQEIIKLGAESTKASNALDNFTTNSLVKLNDQILKSDSSVAVSLTKLEEMLEKHVQISNTIRAIAIQMPESLQIVEETYKESSIQIQSAVKQSNDSLIALEQSLIKITEKIIENVR